MMFLFSMICSHSRRTGIWTAVALCLLGVAPLAGPVTAQQVDFNRDIRAILSNKCYTCHGPDENERQSGLRLDTAAGATVAADSGDPAIVPGRPQDSQLILRITSSDDDVRMPPVDAGKQLTPHEIDLLTRWVEQGGAYARHWSYAPPERPPLPQVTEHAAWPRTAIDFFVLDRLLREKLAPASEADRYALIRRLSLDLTGLPPTLAEVDEFVNDPEPRAYDKLVDRLLQSPAFGEHWGRMWLDLARYADSAGYADDPPRTIWGFRDYVIRAINANKPFDEFTIEQIAGDLLPAATDEQLIATAFHRNTLTNNEGGTNDEEFRNVAVVDRVNTTMAVWMGTTIDCAQCHTHKFDPISQEEYFRFFAFFNNSQDADRRDESPLVQAYSDEQRRQQSAWQTEMDALQHKLQTMTPELQADLAAWQQQFTKELGWQPLRPDKLQTQAGADITANADGAIQVARKGKTDIYSLEFPIGNAGSLQALQIATLPDDSLPNQGPGHADGNFVITRVSAAVIPPQGTRLSGRYVRIDLPGENKMLSLAEVQVYNGEHNLAQDGKAQQSSTDYEGPAKLAIDGNTDGNYTTAKSTTHTKTSTDPWWEVDLQKVRPIDRIVIWNRTDNNLQSRLNGFRVSVLDDNHQPVWEQTVAEAPRREAEYSLDGIRSIPFQAAFADHSQDSFPALSVVNNQDKAKQGWAIAPQVGQPHGLTLIAASPVDVPAGSRISLTIEQLSKFEYHTLGRFQVSSTGDPHAAAYAQTPSNILAIVQTPAEQRSDEQQAALAEHYLSIAPALQADRERLAQLHKMLAETKPATTVPVMRELPTEQRRVTRIQRRGNFLDTTDEVTEGTPAAFHPLPEAAPRNRLTLARWLVDGANPLTPRVIANRYWEAIFGRGIVRTSEEFGSQGDLPSHPELLDWLATELPRLDWDMKAFVRLLVTSAAYRQSSAVTPEIMERDPDNRLLARGPRFRLSAEMVRDQALLASGLLSHKMHGAPVKPPQPNIGLNAAFGSGIDWKTSKGADRYRRGLYTTWRRSNPYPSMAAFDAPNREVCTIRRDRTNTPLQALVTLNDPVYVEAAQALARRMATAGESLEAKATHGFRLCLSRPPRQAELDQLTNLYRLAHERFMGAPDAARQMATEPLGPAPPDSNLTELAAWTVVGNVLLNLDEMFLKR